MPNKYLLPCSCGASLTIDVGQAGQRLECVCGRSVEVPSMRAIRLLEPDSGPSEPAERTAAAAQHSPAGILVAIGTLLAVGGLAVGGYAAYHRVQLTVPLPAQAEVDAWLGEIDASTPDQLWDIWTQTLASGLGDYEASPFVILRREARYYARISYVGFGVAAAGLLLACGPFFFRPRQS